MPRPHERASVIQHHDITVNVRTAVIPETPAELLLSDPLTACFAPGADPGAMNVDELCERVAKALVRRKLPLSPEQEARIAACDDLPTLKRWHDQAIDADSAAKALSA